jgi:hypothetical protein
MIFEGSSEVRPPLTGRLLSKEYDTMNPESEHEPRAQDTDEPMILCKFYCRDKGAGFDLVIPASRYQEMVKAIQFDYPGMKVKKLSINN